MIIISGHITFNPAKEADALAIFAPLCATTRAEPGNLSYGFYLDPGEPGRVQVYEEWETQDALDTHMASEHMAGFLGALGTIDVSGASLNKHEVSSSSPLM
jgi:quinol monooxygenase YgiN